MDKISLKAQERIVLGKKVKHLRKDGFVPGHVYGKDVDLENVTVSLKDFLDVYDKAGETGLIDLKIGEEKTKPVLIRSVDVDPVRANLLNIDFYQVNLKEKVKVYVPLVLEGDEPESVHAGETVVLQTLNEVEVEALPTDLIDQITVNINALKKVDDSITLGQLSYDRTKIEVLTDPDEVVVKLAPAVTEEMKALLEEQNAEAEAANEEQAAEAAEETGETAEGEEGAEGETTEGGETESATEGEATENSEETKE